MTIFAGKLLSRQVASYASYSACCTVSDISIVCRWLTDGLRFVCGHLGEFHELVGVTFGTFAGEGRTRSNWARGALSLRLAHLASLSAQHICFFGGVMGTASHNLLGPRRPHLLRMDW